jgi:hypothetical protein
MQASARLKTFWGLMICFFSCCFLNAQELSMKEASVIAKALDKCLRTSDVVSGSKLWHFDSTLIPFQTKPFDAEELSNNIREIQKYLRRSLPKTESYAKLEVKKNTDLKWNNLSNAYSIEVYYPGHNGQYVGFTVWAVPMNGEWKLRYRMRRSSLIIG